MCALRGVKDFGVENGAWIVMAEAGIRCAFELFWKNCFYNTQ
jgi:hypothetical protein